MLAVYCVVVFAKADTKIAATIAKSLAGLENNAAWQST
jgi:hypothetical protein